MQPTEREIKMLNEHDSDLSTRVTRVESAVESLTGTMNEVSTSIKHIERSMANVGKTDMKTLITIVASVATVAFTVWAMLVAPITQQIGDMKEDLGKLDRSVVSYITLPSDLTRLSDASRRNTDRIDALEKKDVIHSERERITEEAVRELKEKSAVPRR